MALALAGAMVFSSCHKDDDDDDNSSISQLSATVNENSFKTSLAAFYSSSSSGTTKLSQIFSSTSGATTIAGTQDGKQLAITINGTTSGTYNLSVSADNTINNTLINILSGESVTDAISDAVNVKTDAMVIYRATGETEGGNTYYFSTEATVNFNVFVAYATGTFTATMRNKAGDSFSISDGEFKVFGKPVTSSK